MLNNDTVTTNKLIDETNPYLLQHAHDPVDWHTWTSETFEKARTEDKPIFLSIGYSTCHWCHVMAKESFRNEEVAKMMNDIFVCIKVDREERPDIDSIYMDICQKMNGSGGWPLTVLMTPDKVPFITATYIPAKSSFGRKGMLDILPWVNDLWKNDRNKILEQTEMITKAISENNKVTEQGSFTEEIFHKTYHTLEKMYDTNNGGFGDSPKFPTPHNLLYLLRYWKRTGNNTALQMVEATLKAMRNGGIYDHVGYGFHRYSTDSSWLVPHFEKMLYDQALLTIAYIETYQATKKEEYANTANEILEYVERDMTSNKGGFYCAEDADSEGVEGKFYTWTRSDLEKILDQNDGAIFEDAYSISKDGNFLNESTKQADGTNIPHIRSNLFELKKQYGLSDNELKTTLQKCRELLFSAREQRIHPSKDNKILTDWNGLMLAAYSISGRVLKQKRYIDIAKRNADFLISDRIDQNGNLYHNNSSDTNQTLGFLDDHAFFTWGLIELYESTFETKYLKCALQLTAKILKHFKDHDNGGFYQSSDINEDLLFRKKDVHDGAIPSGNSVTLQNLLRLSKLTADLELDNEAIELAECFVTIVKAIPPGYTHFISALNIAFGPTNEIIIVGELDSEETQLMIDAIYQEYDPLRTVIIKDKMSAEDLELLAPHTSTYNMKGNRATAFVCQDHECSLPINELNELVQKLSQFQTNQ